MKMAKFPTFVTLDRVILHTVMHHSSTSTYIPNFTEIEETFCGQTDGHLRATLLGRLGGVDLIKQKQNRLHSYPFNYTFIYKSSFSALMARETRPTWRKLQTRTHSYTTTGCVHVFIKNAIYVKKLTFEVFRFLKT